MEISLIYNYSEGESDMNDFDFDPKLLKSKKKFAEWLINLPTTFEEPEDEDEDPYDLSKLDKLTFVSCCINTKGESIELPKWYTGRIYFTGKKMISLKEHQSKLW